jgi:peptidylprolyl isomerase domain and WD repeat-containing protein 1
MTEFDQVGPSPPPLKRAKVLEHEHLFTQELPNTDQYETSLMHRDVVNYCFVTKTDFLITTSIDGHVKFWKKVEKGVEFVKHFRAHLGLICTADVTFDGRSFASASVDKFIKVFDVITFDMINMIKLDYLPNSVCWVNRPSKALTLLAWYCIF